MNETGTHKSEISASPEIELRSAVPADAESIRTVQVETWKATYPDTELGITEDDIRIHLEGEQGEKIQPRIERMRSRLEHPDDKSHTFVGLIDGEIVGYVAPFVEASGRRRLGALYVLPTGQRHGLGGKLLNAALDWHGRENPVYLNVAAHNANAIKFYEKHGFVLTGNKGSDEIANIDGKVMPELEMVHPASVDHNQPMA